MSVILLDGSATKHLHSMVKVLIFLCTTGGTTEASVPVLLTALASRREDSRAGEHRQLKKNSSA